MALWLAKVNLIMPFILSMSTGLCHRFDKMLHIFPKINRLSIKTSPGITGIFSFTLTAKFTLHTCPLLSPERKGETDPKSRQPGGVVPEDLLLEGRTARQRPSQKDLLQGHWSTRRGSSVGSLLHHGSRLDHLPMCACKSATERSSRIRDGKDG